MGHELLVRKATIGNMKACQTLVNGFAKENLMLARSLGELYENVRDFFVCEQAGHIVGCAALHVMWDDLAEIKSAAVARTHQRQGAGSRLVQACLKEARELGIPRVFVLTYQRDYFAKQGFKEVSKDTLNQKVWAECVRCPHFPDCDEIAMDMLL